MNTPLLISKLHGHQDDLRRYLEQLGVSFPDTYDTDLLIQSFVHKSFAADYKDTVNHNERLEFVGDGILGAVINRLLFVNHPEMPESELTLYKIALVREEILAEIARDIHLDAKLFVSKGEEKTQGRKKDSILSDGVEAIIGFLYIGLGVQEAEKFIQTYVYSKMSDIVPDTIKSYKTQVQEMIQKQYKNVPEYRDIEHEIDPRGNVVQYKSELRIEGQKAAEWLGTNKKKAQEAAAKNYYTHQGK